MSYYVNVYNEEDREEIVSRVRYNKDLDSWDGRNFCNGGVGRHKGITKLKDGRYVIIVGSNWEGEKDYAYLVSKEEALKEILESGNTELLESKRFADLKEMDDRLKNLEDIDE